MSHTPKPSSPEHRAAIDRLPIEPGPCPTCGTPRTCCVLEEWLGEPHPIPPPRFGCAEHEVALAQCVDNDVSDKGYLGGLWTAALRDPVDPSWDWIPKRIRAVCARASFGIVAGFFGFPNHGVGVIRDRLWIMEGRWALLDTGEPASALAAAEEALGWPEEMREQYRIPVEATERALAALEVFPVMSKAPPPAWATEYGVTIGCTVVSRRLVELVETIYPDAVWKSRGEREMVLAVAEGRTVALFAPLSEKQASRRAAAARRSG